jgi:hypothetical protein
MDIEMREAVHNLLDEALDAIDASADDPDAGAHMLYTVLVGIVHGGPETDNQEQYETAWNHFYGGGLKVLTEGTVQ